MAIIDKMELFLEPEHMQRLRSSSHSTPLFITVTPNYFTFSTAAAKIMKDPPYLHMYVDKKNKRVAFKACEQDDSAIAFCVKTPSGHRRAVIFSRNKSYFLRELAGIKKPDEVKSVRFPAEYIENEQTLVVDLSKTLGQIKSIPLTVRSSKS